jgi:hypothetical protein
LQKRTLRVESEDVITRSRRRGDCYLVERGDVSCCWGTVLGGAVDDLSWRECELGVVGLVRLPLLESGNDARGGYVVGADQEVEGGSCTERAEEDSSVPVPSAIDVDGDAIVVAVATLI